MSIYLKGGHGVGPFGPESLKPGGDKWVKGKEQCGEKDEIQPSCSKRLPTVVLEPQRGKTFFMPYLPFQPFSFP